MVKATIQLPASKSISNRALIINALGKGIYPPENLSDCDDTQVMIKALTEVKDEKEEVKSQFVITGGGGGSTVNRDDTDVAAHRGNTLALRFNGGLLS